MVGRLLTGQEQGGGGVEGAGGKACILFMAQPAPRQAIVSKRSASALGNEGILEDSMASPRYPEDES